MMDEGLQGPWNPLLKITSYSRAEVFRPVVMGLGNHCNDVLDLLFQAKGWTGRQKQHGAFAPHTHIFHHNRSQQSATTRS